MPQESATNETNDATISSAPGRKFAVYQEVIFVSEKHSLVLYTSMKLTIFFPISFFLFGGFVNPLNQPTSMSDTSATVMVHNTLQPQNDYPMQEGNILNGPLPASTNYNLINPLHIADAGRSKSGYIRPIINSSTYIMIS